MAIEVVLSEEQEIKLRGEDAFKDLRREIQLILIISLDSSDRKAGREKTIRLKTCSDRPLEELIEELEEFLTVQLKEKGFKAIYKKVSPTTL